MLEKETILNKVSRNSGLPEFPLLIISFSPYQKKKTMKTKFETETHTFLNSCEDFSCYLSHVTIHLVFANHYLNFCLNNLGFWKSINNLLYEINNLWFQNLQFSLISILALKSSISVTIFFLQFSKDSFKVCVVHKL